MEPHRLPVDAWMQRDPVTSGHVWAVTRGPRTVEQVLADASRLMDAEDAELERMRDPVAYVAAQRRRSTLWGRLFGRR